MSKTVDFDAFRKEQKNEPIILKAYGKKFKLPAKLPAIIPVRLMRMVKGGMENVPEHEVFELLEKTVGEKVFDSLLEEGLAVDELETLFQMIIESYTGQVTKSEEEDKTPR